MLYIEQAVNAAQKNVNKDDMLRDLTACTCILVRDGLNFTFSHRSFQEYFVACFIAGRKNSDHFNNFILNVARRSTRDNIIPMLAAMDEERFEEEWALPNIKKCLAAVKPIDSTIQPAAYCTALFGHSPRVSILKGEEVGFGYTLHRDNSKKETLSIIREILVRVYTEDTASFDVLPWQNQSGWIEDVKAGNICQNDPRFARIKNNTDNEDVVEIRVRDEDNSWALRTCLAHMIREFDTWLTKLHTDVENRVQGRTRGLMSILETYHD